MKIAERQERMGSDSANGILGYCYEHGYGTEQNLSLAIDYYREAANQDHYKRLSQQLYKNVSSSPETRTNFLQRLKSIIHNQCDSSHKWHPIYCILGVLPQNVEIWK